MIRLATLDDLAEIMECVKDARGFLRLNGLSQWNGPLGYPNEEIFKSDINEKQCYVVCEENEVLAVATFKGHEKEYDQTDLWHDKSFDYTTVHRICVKNKARGKGYAKKLLIFCEKYSLDLNRKSIKIDTHPNNMVMQGLLDALRYKKLGSIIYSYIPVEPERLIYERLLNER